MIENQVISKLLEDKNMDVLLDKNISCSIFCNICRRSKIYIQSL